MTFKSVSGDSKDKDVRQPNNNHTYKHRDFTVTEFEKRWLLHT